ncbi:MAG: NfeD family protein [Thermoguttaceae bacterium]
MALGAMAADGPAADRAAANGEATFGATMRLNLPIDDRTRREVERFSARTLAHAAEQNARPVLIFEFFIPPEGEEHGRGSDFFTTHGLAEYLSGKQMNRATTVAYIPQTVQGHAVLAAIACDEIIMAPGAELGPAGVDDELIDETRLSVYRKIAQRRRTVPVAVALGLLDPRLEVLRAETELGREYVLPDELEAIRKTRTVESTEVLFAAGQPGRVTGREARSLGLIDYLATDRREVAAALGLASDAMLLDPSLGDQWRAIQVDVKGPINATLARQVKRLIEDAMRERDVNFVCLWIDSPGGSLVESVDLANYLAELPTGRIRTVAYIPAQARGDAALIALACDQVVVHPGAVLGGPGAYQPSEEQVKHARATIRESLAPAKGRSWSLPAAVIDPNLAVFECRRLNLVEYFSEEELADQPGDWEQGRRVTTPDTPFRARGRDAVEYGLASRVVESFEELKRHFALEDDPHLVAPGWTDHLVEVLGAPGVTMLLLIVGGFALYFELHTPGLGIGGFVATVCFALFFWANYLGGTAGWLEVLLFTVGVACLLLELFVLPGFGIFGLGGGALVILSLVLASQTFIVPRNPYQLARFQQSMLTLAGAGVGIVAVALLARRWLPSTPGLRHVVLAPPEGEEAAHLSRREALVDLSALLGKRGRTTTPLSPSGKARFDNLLVNVLTDGEPVPRGATVEVIEVHGSRVVVSEVRSGA